MEAERMRNYRPGTEQRRQTHEAGPGDRSGRPDATLETGQTEQTCAVRVQSYRPGLGLSNFATARARPESQSREGDSDT